MKSSPKQNSDDTGAGTGAFLEHEERVGKLDPGDERVSKLDPGDERVGKLDPGDERVGKLDPLVVNPATFQGLLEKAPTYAFRSFCPPSLGPEVIAALAQGFARANPEASAFRYSPYEHLFDKNPLEDGIKSLTASIRQELSDEKSQRKLTEAELQKVQKDLQALQHMRGLAFLLSKITPLAQDALLSDKPLKGLFFSEQPQRTFVMSMDIRRSTELMLKARRPELFAQFMTILCDDLETMIKNHYGVVDKFTGDGMLAFFPEFFSGPDAGYHAIATAKEAHQTFAKRYREHRSSFSTVLNDVGMGIGLDYGDVSLMRVAGGLTVVGPAVVYACRMGGAPAGKTYLNQPAYEKITEGYSASCFLGETELEIKHEGSILVYEASLKENNGIVPRLPSWLESV